MYAMIEESGGQRKVVQGEVILVDLLDKGEAAVGKKVTFDKVLIVGGVDGQDAKIGAPYVKGATVTAEVLEPLYKGEKLVIWHFGAKKGWRRKKGHRQQYTKVRVSAINA